MNKVVKFFRIVTSGYLRDLLATGVAAAVEHERVLRSLGCQMVVDIGANRGQFALVARKCFPNARIVSVEPLEMPARKFRRAFSNDSATTLHKVAVGHEVGVKEIHVSGRDDSSSLLPITEAQVSVFPGTKEVATEITQVVPLSRLLPEGALAPALLKVDVQGYELEVLRGCEDMVGNFDYVYVECSFMELYKGQCFADEMIVWLSERHFRLRGVYNLCYASGGAAVQGDFFFVRG